MEKHLLKAARLIGPFVFYLVFEYLYWSYTYYQGYSSIEFISGQLVGSLGCFLLLLYFNGRRKKLLIWAGIALAILVVVQFFTYGVITSLPKIDWWFNLKTSTSIEYISLLFVLAGSFVLLIRGLYLFQKRKKLLWEPLMLLILFLALLIGSYYYFVYIWLNS